MGEKGISSKRQTEIDERRQTWKEIYYVAVAATNALKFDVQKKPHHPLLPIAIGRDNVSKNVAKLGELL